MPQFHPRPRSLLVWENDDREPLRQGGSLCQRLEVLLGRRRRRLLRVAQDLQSASASIALSNDEVAGVVSHLDNANRIEWADAAVFYDALRQRLDLLCPH